MPHPTCFPLTNYENEDSDFDEAPEEIKTVVEALKMMYLKTPTIMKVKKKSSKKLRKRKKET